MAMFRLRFLLPAIALVVVGVGAVAAGWWFFVREDNQLATSAPDIPSDLVGAARTPGADATAAAPPGDMLTFRVIAERSEAAYFAGETLASVGLPSTAKGATKEIQGEFHLAPDGLALAEGATSSFTVQLAHLVSNEGRRDNRVREALEVGRYPAATFTVSGVRGYDPAIAEGEEQSLALTGTLDLHGVQREVTWDVLARREGDVFTALATLDFLYSDFNIAAPNIGGFVSVEEDVTLQVQIVAQAVR